jgi:hypothetical protein
MLSEHAARVLEALDLRRDATESCTREQLRGMLRERRLPVYSPALDMEEHAGGAILWHRSTIGVCSAIKAFERGGQRLTVERLSKVEGQPLLPFFHARDLVYWMDRHGRLYFEDLSEPVPTYDSFAHFIEAFAFTAERSQDAAHWHRVHVPAQVGAQLAESIHAPVFEPAVGERFRLWWRDPLVIEEQLFGQFGEWTRAYTPRASDAAEVLIAMQSIAPGQASWSGPSVAARRGRAELRHRIEGRSEGGHAETYEIWERGGACWIARESSDMAS